MERAETESLAAGCVHGGTGSASEVLNLNTGRACEAIKGLLGSGHWSRFLETWPIIFNADSR